MMTPEDEVLFPLTVTTTWLRQVIVALTLIRRSSYCGVVEFVRGLLGVPISIGAVLFQGTKPVLAGPAVVTRRAELEAPAPHCATRAPVAIMAATRERADENWPVLSDPSAEAVDRGE
jgi:hypothetical protein